MSPGDDWIRLRPVSNNPSRDLQTFAGVAFAQGRRGDIGINPFKNLLGRWREQFVGTFRIDTLGARKKVSPVYPQPQPELLLCNCELPRNIRAASDGKKGADVGGDGFERQADCRNHDAGKIGLQRNLWPVFSRMGISDDLIQSIVQPLCRDFGRVAVFRQHLWDGYRRDRNRLLCESFPQKNANERKSQKSRKLQDDLADGVPNDSYELPRPCYALPNRSLLINTSLRNSCFGGG